MSLCVVLNNWDVVFQYNIPCNSRTEALIEETKFIKEQNCELNSVLPFVSEEEKKANKKEIDIKYRAKKKAEETEEERIERLANEKKKRDEKLANETEEEKKERKANEKKKRDEKLANETEEEKAERKRKKREQKAAIRAKKKAEKEAQKNLLPSNELKLI